MKRKQKERLWVHRRPDYKLTSRATPYDPAVSRVSDKAFVKRERKKRRRRQAWYYQTKRIPRERKISTLPVWFWPIVILSVLILLIFLIVPEIVDRSAGRREQIAETDDPKFEALFDDQVRVVNESFLTLYEEP
ncbi:MAG TPA: hypothetical protein GX717_00290, partial [Clostridiaceae bacterium]|nr:hypothetical protein [Clostridiaceae bacterium]